MPTFGRSSTCFQSSTSFASKASRAWPSGPKAGGVVGGRQRGAIELAVRRQGDPIDDHDVLRHHVGWQLLAEAVAEVAHEVAAPPSGTTYATSLLVSPCGTPTTAASRTVGRPTSTARISPGSMR